MRKKRVAETVCSAVLVFLLSFSLVSSFPYAVNIHNSEPGSMQVGASSDDDVRPIIRHPDMMDKDFNGIQDSLELLILQEASNGSAVLPVVVTLNNPVTGRDLNSFTMLRGQVTYIYPYVTYGFAGVIPASNILSFAQLEGENLVIVEYDAPISYHLDVSVSNIRARPIVWNTYGLLGSSNHSIAVIDTGIDDSHPDVGPYGDLNFSRKIVGWYDATSDGSPTPEDHGEHGTHVAAIAAGTGTASSLQGSGNIPDAHSNRYHQRHPPKFPPASRHGPYP